MSRTLCVVAGAVCAFGAVSPARAIGPGPTSFGPNEDWTHGSFYNALGGANRGNFFADVNGDKRADAILVTDFGTFVRRSNGDGFDPAEVWSPTPFIGALGTFFADVDGDGWADAIAVNSTGITVRRAAANCFFTCWNYRFDPPQTWTMGLPFSGTYGTFFADVDGDGRADAIAVNANNVLVRRSMGWSFGATEVWSFGPLQGSVDVGTYRTYFFDANGDGKADVVAVNTAGTFGNPTSTVIVRLSSGLPPFGAPANWSGADPAIPAYGSRSIAFAMSEAYGANLPLMIDVNDSGVLVRPKIFGSYQNWTGGPFYGTQGTFFADVTGDGRADAIVVNNDTIVVRRAIPESF